MPVSGLVITLSPDDQSRTSALTAIRNHAALTLGEGDGVRLPLVVDTANCDEDRELWHWLHDLPGVSAVDLVYAHF